MKLEVLVQKLQDIHPYLVQNCSGRQCRCLAQDIVGLAVVGGAGEDAGFIVVGAVLGWTVGAIVGAIYREVVCGIVVLVKVTSERVAVFLVGALLDCAKPHIPRRSAQHRTACSSDSGVHSTGIELADVAAPAAVYTPPAHRVLVHILRVSMPHPDPVDASFMTSGSAQRRPPDAAHFASAET